MRNKNRIEAARFIPEPPSEPIIINISVPLLFLKRLILFVYKRIKAMGVILNGKEPKN